MRDRFSLVSAFRDKTDAKEATQKRHKSVTTSLVDTNFVKTRFSTKFGTKDFGIFDFSKT